MFLWYFVMPELVPAAVGDWLKSLPEASFVTAFLALGFFTSSRVAVQVSTGINALPRGQRMAGAALGLTPVQTYRYVLLPMAFRIIIPALTNEFAAIIKNSSVALTIGLVELTAATYSMREFTFQTFESLTGATVIYIIISVIALMLARFLERVTAVPGYITTGSSSSGGH
jgi:glutamate/aspartate transport system permease protein